jgi:hypothetical protein
MAAPTAPRQLFNETGHLDESYDGDELPVASTHPSGAIVYAIPDGDYADYARALSKPSTNTTNSDARRLTLVSRPSQNHDSGITLNDAYTGPLDHQNRWNGYMSANQLMESFGGNGRNKDTTVAVPSLPVRLQRNNSRFWHVFNILTFLIACTALAISLAHVAKGNTSGSASTGGVEASAVHGLSRWQEEVTRNLTMIQNNLTALINGLLFLFCKLCFSRLIFSV